MNDLSRSLQQWAACEPRAMATEQSTEAICHAFMDAKNDIRTLAEQRDELADALRKIVADTGDVVPPYRGLGASGPVKYIARAALAKVAS